MMKKIKYILAITILSACSSVQSNDESMIEQFRNSVSDTTISIKADNSLDGVWGLTNYFDTIPERKELAKYRMQEPTWFAFLLEIKNDSLKNFGSINDGEFIINRSKDTLTRIESDISGDNWYLILGDSTLSLVQGKSPEVVDSNLYVFRRRNDLRSFTIKRNGFYNIEKNVTEYFNNEIFKGEYSIESAKKEVIFGSMGKLIGIEGFDSYEIRNYFGTLHMYKNLDVVTFRNSDSNKYKQFNWVFNDDELVLTEFVREKVYSNGIAYDGDYLILGEEKIRMKKH